jgi:tetratricopeptide (TPR) repeat protein
MKRAPVTPYILLLALACSLTPGCGKEPEYSSSSPEAIAAYQEGVRQWRMFYFAEAKESFERAIALDSTFAMAWGRLALVHEGTRNEAAGRAAVDRALDLSVDATERERMYIRLWHALFHYDYTTGARIADSLLQLYPRETEVYVYRGNLWENEKNFDKAVALYRKAVEIDSGFAMGYMVLGYAYSTLGNQEEALAAMERYIALSPNTADPRASYADLLVRVGRYDEALEQYRASLAIRSDYWYAIQEIGKVYTTLGRLKDAQAQFDRATYLLPANPTLDATRIALHANAEMLRGKYPEAEKLYREALAIDSVSGPAAYGLSMSLAKQQKFADAHTMVTWISRELRTRNLLQSPVAVEFYVLQSRILFEEGRLDEARAKCDSALLLSTPLNRRQVFVQLAKISEREGRYEEALSSIEEALVVNPNGPDALLTLTRVYKGMKDHTMAKEISTRLFELWKQADRDYLPLNELREVVHRPAPPV